ncbi:MAG: UDP-glucose 4-epimerase [Thermodesulfobacteriota bacterium]|nr:UDP-glucose 4-epimerase [Thermodesulfobacteriota bacterium]
MRKSKLLVIGGAGYVGSHFALHAVNRGFHVTIMDNLSKGHLGAVRSQRFVHTDLMDRSGFESHLFENRYDGILHFAASCLVGESVEKPAHYYQNNVIAAFNMLEAMRATGHQKVIFSSTCAVYGVPDSLPIGENHTKQPISPYGRSKLAIEWMLEDYQAAYGIRSAALRYFNAAGCEPSHDLGEDHNPETHLIPTVVRYALGIQKKFTLFGSDYPTPDGTCIRDYIHVTDLAEAHLKALDMLDREPLIRVNLGTGIGLSNKEIVDAVGRVLGRTIHPALGPRRAGDPPELVADAREAQRILNWTPKRSHIDAVVGEVVAWFSKHPNGYHA